MTIQLNSVEPDEARQALKSALAGDILTTDIVIKVRGVGTDVTFNLTVPAGTTLECDPVPGDGRFYCTTIKGFMTYLFV